MIYFAYDFHIAVSNSGLADGDFVTVFSGRKQSGNWEEFTFAPILMRYIKLVIDTPAHGWRQVGEFPVCPVRRYADMNQTRIHVTSPHIANGIDSALITIEAKDAAGQSLNGLTWDDFHFIIEPNYCTLTQISETSPSIYTMKMTSVRPATIA